MSKIFRVDIGTATVLVNANGPKAALKAALATEIVKVERIGIREAYDLGVTGCKLIDANKDPRQADIEGAT